MYATIESPVLVQEDTIYAVERRDHSARLLMLQRPKKTLPGVPLALLMRPTLPWSLFEDKFVSVYATLEVYGPIQAVPPPQQRLVYSSFLSNRLDDADQEDIVHRHNFGEIFQSIRGVAVAFYGYTFEVPDLNDHPWIEWVHPGPTPETQLFPFRQIYSAPIGTSFELLSYKSPNWNPEAEPDTLRATNHGLALYPFRNPQVAPPYTGIEVQVIQAGYYNGVYRNIGDVFYLNSINDLSSSLVDNYPVGGDSPVKGWMYPLSAQLPVVVYAQGLVSTIRTSPRRTVL